jgi:hypothetical protein
MNIIERVKNILLTPKTEWAKINTEPATLGGLITSYTVLLAGVGAAATFLGAWLIGYHGYTLPIKYALIGAVVMFIVVVATVAITALIADAIAQPLGAQKDANGSAKWVVYGLTPLCLAMVLGLIPMADSTWLIRIVGFAWSFYILYIGCPIVKKTPEDKTIPYTAVVTGIGLVVLIILGEIAARIMTKIMY